MLKKPRTLRKELRKMRSLNARMLLSDDDKWNYLNAEKGFAGELEFDKLTEKLQCQCLVINDLQLKLNKSYFQIDTVIIYQREIYLIDVKNFEGDFYYDADGHLKKGNREIKNPLNQLERCENLFRQLLQNYGYKYHVESYLVHINPEFTLYQAPQNDHVIFPTQIKKFMKKLEKPFSRLNEGHERMADLLISLDLEEFPFAEFPPYEYTQLQKGVLSSSCHTLSTSLEGNKIVCGLCGQEESVDSAVLQSVRELVMLFPEIKITTNLVFEWCNEMVSKKTIRRILLQNYIAKGNTLGRYFE